MASRHILSVSILVLFCAAAVPFARAEITIPSDMVLKIKSKTERSYNFYPLDLTRGEAIFTEIDKWAESQLELSDATQLKEKKLSRLTWIEKTAQNKPIFSNVGKEGGLIASGPFRIKFVKKPQGRALVKALRMPAPESMDKQMVAKIAKQFSGKHGFISQTLRDRLGRQVVFDRICRTGKDGDKKGSRLVVLHRAILKRTLDGIEVLNSRQIVDIHSKSGEILAYKHLNWVPADEANSKSLPTISSDAALAAIQKAFKPTAKGQVTGVKLRMYQTDDSIFPVLSVQVNRDDEDPSGAPLIKKILVPLLQGTTLPGREQPGEWPRFAGG